MSESSDQLRKAEQLFHEVVERNAGDRDDAIRELCLEVVKLRDRLQPQSQGIVVPSSFPQVPGTRMGP